MDRLGWRVGADAGKGRRVHCLHADEVKGAGLLSEPADDRAVIGDHTVVARPPVDDGHGHQGVGGHVTFGERQTKVRAILSPDNVN